jgi:dUTP pyrophosphatase
LTVLEDISGKRKFPPVVDNDDVAVPTDVSGKRDFRAFIKSLANEVYNQSTMAEELRVKLLDGRAKLPTKGSSLAAGFDLYAAEDVMIPKKGSATVSTGIAICVPLGTYGRVASRSGLAFKFDLDVAAGVIDRVRTHPV